MILIIKAPTLRTKLLSKSSKAQVSLLRLPEPLQRSSMVLLFTHERLKQETPVILCLDAGQSMTFGYYTAFSENDGPMFDRTS